MIAVFGVMLAVTTVERSAAQAKPPATTAKPPAAAGQKTTMSGIYTSAQVDRGEQMYYTVCIACHPKGTYAGPGFKANWGGKPLSDLYDWVLNKMPKNDPGTLTPQESVDVIAYILKQNGMPEGTTTIPTDMRTLRSIKIQLR
jgi:mono/diheme cytochrome c family protein